VLIALAYVGAAALPCPPAADPIPQAEVGARHGAHAVAAQHADARESEQPPCHALGHASLTLPCPCGCGERAAGAGSAQRLGAAVLPQGELLRSPFNVFARREPELRAPSRAPALPDPVPIA